MKRLLKSRLLIWLALAVFLAWALRGIPVDEIWAALSGLSPVAILILVSTNLSILLVFSSRWWLVLRAQGYRIPYLSLVMYRLAAFGITYFTPGTQFGGEPLQVYTIQERHQVPATTAIASISLDKLLELFVNFAFLVLGAAVVLNEGSFGSEISLQVLVLAIGLMSLPAGYLLLLHQGKSPLEWLGRHLPASYASRWPMLLMVQLTIRGAEEQVAQFCRNKPGKIVQALLISILVWIAMIFEYWLTLHFLGLRLTLAQSISALTAARVAYLLPVPAGLGALEASQVIAMQALGYPPALGISISLLIRARDITFSGIGLWWAGVVSRPSSVKSLPMEAGD